MGRWIGAVKDAQYAKLTSRILHYIYIFRSKKRYNGNMERLKCTYSL